MRILKREGKVLSDENAGHLQSAHKSIKKLLAAAGADDEQQPNPDDAPPPPTGDLPLPAQQLSYRPPPFTRANPRPATRDGRGAETR